MDVSDKAQRNRLIKFLKGIIEQLEKAPENLNQAPATRAVPAPKKKLVKGTALKTRKKTVTRKRKAVTA